MNAKLKAALKSFGKYVLWTAVAASIQYAVNHMGAWHVPDVYVPLLGGALKAAASWVATQEGG